MSPLDQWEQLAGYVKRNSPFMDLVFVGVKNVFSPCGHPSKYSTNAMLFVFLYCASKNMVRIRQHIKIFLSVYPRHVFTNMS
jgi:hypothetical protein